jgi:TRAP-type C4-dicarboxylate transport system substrate-binding protein
MIRLGLLAVAALGVAPGAARAGEEITLRLASPAPEGTAWAREGRAFARDLEALTHGTVHMKFYLGGITGDELQTAERIRRGQLDAIASGGMLCQRLAPSMRVLRVLGLFQSREESAYVAGRLRQTLDAEFLKSGFVNLGEVGVGPDVFFSRTPIRSIAELKKARLWVWDLDELFKKELSAIGVPVVPLPLEQSAHAFDENKTDGWIAVPTAALAFQWSAQARYYADMRVGFLRGCTLVSAHTFDSMPVGARQALREASAKLIARLEDLGRSQDEALMSGLFERQGLHRVEIPDGFRAEFYDGARAVRERMGDELVPQELLQRVLGMLADFRAEHPADKNVAR